MNELIIKVFINIDDKQELEKLVEKIDLKNKQYFELDILKNPDFNERIAKIFPDGFLHFPYIIEYYKSEKVFDDKDINNSRTILETLWEKNIPAIAASDYEEKLPENGGYKSKKVPWKL